MGVSCKRGVISKSSTGVSVDKDAVVALAVEAVVEQKEVADSISSVSAGEADKEKEDSLKSEYCCNISKPDNTG
jgi:hypothetical protein